MKFSLNSKSKCTLELDGNLVELTAEELSGLRGCLADSGKEPRDALPQDLFKRLFETGIVRLDRIQEAAGTSYWKQRLPSLSLSQYLKLDLKFSAGAAGMHATEPAIGIFLEPEFVDAASQLLFEIQSVLAGAAHAGAVRGISFPRNRALRLVHRVAHEWLENRPQLNRWLEWRFSETGSLSLRVPNYAILGNSRQPCPWISTIRISHRTETARPAIQVLVPVESLPEIATLIDALREDATNISDHELSSIHARRILGAIESVGGFSERDQAPPVFSAPATNDTAMAITHMGHASLIVDAGGKRILVDPWLFNGDSSFEKQPVISGQLGRVDAIFFTHHHEDHLNSSSLLMLPHNVPVFVPALTGSPLEPQTAKFLRTVGFSQVRELAHGESVDLGNGLNVEAVRFFGEGKNHLGFGANCYLMSRNGRTVLVHADASPDSEGKSIVNTGTLKQIVERRGPIDVVFGTWWQERKFLFELSPLAMFLPDIQPEDWLNDTEMCDCSPDFICDVIKISGAKLMITYAESGPESFLPRQMMSSYVPMVSFLWKSLEEIRQAVRHQTGADVVEAQPYLTVVIPERGDPYVDESRVAETRKAH
jgi:L-ascorbate metabolism protein UlaG (beta-lactamase superfamily)